MNILRVITVIVLFFQISAAWSETGPKVGPLEVSYMYSQGTSFYIIFPEGSMPGCHDNRGGRLHDSHRLFDQLYSQVLLMVSGVKMDGQVIYKIDNPGGGQWSDCSIDGLILYPE